MSGPLTSETATWKSTLWQWHSHFLIFLFHLLVGLTPFLFTWVNEELFEFNKMIAVYALTVLILVVWINKMILAEKWLIKRTFLDIPLGLFLLSQVVSTVLSIHIPTSLFGYYTRFHGGLLSTLCYILLYYAAVNNLRWKDIPPLLMTTIGAALGSALYAIPEHFGHSPSCWLITSGMATGPVFDVSCWVQDVKSRVFGTFGQPNWLAAYAIMLIPVTLVSTQIWRWYQQNWSRWLAGLAAVTTVALLVVLLFTQSRSGFFGLGVGLAVLGVGTAGLFWQAAELRKNVVQLWPLGLVGLLCAIAVIIFGTPITPSLTTALKPPQPAISAPSTTTPATPADRLEAGGTDSGEIRKIVWAGAMNVWRRYPLFGSGVETFAYSYYQDRPLAHNTVSEWDFLYNKAHNEFLNYLATTGLFGLSTALLVLGWFAVQTLAAVYQSKSGLSLWQRWFLLSLVAGLAALSVSNFFGFSTVMVTVLMYLFFALTEIILHETKAAKLTSADLSLTEPLSPLTVGGLGLMGLVGAYLLFQTYLTWKADFYFAQGKSYIASAQVDQGLSLLQQALLINPQEGLYYDELAQTSGEIAVYLARQNQATASAQFVSLATQTSDQALTLNPRHLSFYRTRASLFMSLAEIDPRFLDEAYRTLSHAWELAPTDAKIVYNLGLVELDRQHEAEGQKLLEKAIEMKPNYESARYQLAQLYEKQQRWPAAQSEYEYILNSINPNNQTIKESLARLEASISATKR